MITSDTCNSHKNTVFKVCGNRLCDKSYETLRKCIRCRLEAYCGVDCQKADWPKHKKICVSSPISMLEKQMPIPGLRLVENFISDDLHKRFTNEMGYGIPEWNDGHYDRYMFNNVESFDKVFDDLTKDVFSKLKKLNYFSEEKKPIKLACTINGYKKDGFIEPHIDSTLLSGGTVVAISFNTPVVVNFYSQKKTEQQQHKIFVPPKSMYSISGEARYEWRHAILSDEDTYLSKKFERGIRYSVLFTPPGLFYHGSDLLDY